MNNTPSPESIFLKHLAPTSPFPLKLNIAKAEGSYLYDTDGKAYLDMIAGLSVANIGHRHPHVVQALHRQIDRHLHTMVYGEYIQESSNQLAQKLAELLPKPLDCCYFTNSGAEAIEGALKLAKRVTGRSKIIAFRGAYHGSTHGALSVSGSETKKRAFRPLLPDVHFIEFNVKEQLAAIDKHTAAVIMETVQGDAGIRIPHPEFMIALRQKCNHTGTLLILDEIQCGMGRTGKMFAFEHYGIVPDVVCLAKAFGGGLPLGAFVASHAQMQSFTHRPMLGHITTFGGNPVSCAAANATLEVIHDENILDAVEPKGALIADQLQHSRIKEIRRIGMYFAFEFATAAEVQLVVQESLKQGVICFWFLSCPNAFRIAPPLNIGDDEIKKACTIIKAQIDKLL